MPHKCANGHFTVHDHINTKPQDHDVVKSTGKRTDHLKQQIKFS